MTGRYALACEGSVLAARFGLEEVPELEPVHILTPRRDAPVIVSAEGVRTLLTMSWRFVSPFHSSNEHFNAWAPAAAATKSFLPPLRLRRCLLPASGFFAWTGLSGRRIPHYARLRTGQPFGIAAVWSAPDQHAVESAELARDRGLGGLPHSTRPGAAWQPAGASEADDLEHEAWLSSLAPRARERWVQAVGPGRSIDDVPHALTSRSASTERGFAMLITPPNALLKELGMTEMPLILREQDEEAWLDDALTETESLPLWKAAFSASGMSCYRVRRDANEPWSADPRNFRPVRNTRRAKGEQRPPAMRRRSPRKRRIETWFQEPSRGGVVLLEELRWWVLRQEAQERGDEALELMSRSAMNSFARTVRVHAEFLHTWKLPFPEVLPAGIVTRAALYRLRSWEGITRFLRARKPRVLCRYQRRDRTRKCVKLAFHTSDDFSASTHVASVGMPVTKPLTVVAMTPLVDEAFEALAAVHWGMLRVTGGRDLDAWPEPRQRVRPIEATDAVNPRWRKRARPRVRIPVRADGSPGGEQPLRI